MPTKATPVKATATKTVAKKAEEVAKPTPRVKPQYGLVKIGSLPNQSRKGRARTVEHIPFMQQLVDAGPAEPNEDGTYDYYQLSVYAGLNGAASVATAFRKGRRELPEGTEPSHWKFRALEAADGSNRSVLAICYLGPNGTK
jgi:hypothetical protein